MDDLRQKYLDAISNAADEAALEETRLELSAEREARRFSDQARKVAIQEADRQAERAETVKARTIVIRKRPDGDEQAVSLQHADGQQQNGPGGRGVGERAGSEGDLTAPHRV